MIANRYRREGLTLWWCPFFVGVFPRGVHFRRATPRGKGTKAAAVVMNGHRYFLGVGAFSMVGHSGIHSNIKILEKLG